MIVKMKPLVEAKAVAREEAKADSLVLEAVEVRE